MDYSNIFYNYVYLDPRKPGDYNYGDLHFDYVPFYIGKGLFDRCYAHLNETEETTYNLHKVRIINKIKKQGLEPIILKIYENLEESIAFQNEIDLIGIIGRHDKKLGPLANLTDGGDGMTGYKFTEKQLKNVKLSKSGKNNPFFGKTLSDKHIINLGAKSVYSYNCDGSLAGKFLSIRKASTFYNINRGDIMRCLNGKLKTAGGYYWSYIENNDINYIKEKFLKVKRDNCGIKNSFYGKKHNHITIEILKKPKSEEHKNKLKGPKSEEHKNKLSKSNKGKGCKIVVQYDKEYNYINEFSAIYIASEITGIYATSISRCCRGILKFAGNYIWKFKNEI